MKNFSLNIDEKTQFKAKRNSALRINIVIAIFIFIIVYSASDWRYSTAIAVFFLLVQYFKFSSRIKHFITHIEFHDSWVLVKYKEGDNQKELTGKTGDFSIEKKTAFNKTRTVYLSIKKKSDEEIQQFEIDDWNEACFDKVLDAWVV